VATILVIEDEVNIAAAIARCVESAGHICHIAYSGQSGLSAFEDRHPDLIILDLNLPDIDGLEVCAKIRIAQVAQVKVPHILMLTVRAEEMSRIIGYSTGADNYMSKPFSPADLLVRVQALLRRDQWRTALTPAKTVATRHLLIDLDQRTVQARAVSFSPWVKISLGPLDFDVLSAMAQKPGRIWTRDKLLELWEPGSYEGMRVVDACIKRIRQKLCGVSDQEIDTQRFIQTKLGVGYVFTDD
jgi:DNA-binding response OmpR family regulator